MVIRRTDTVILALGTLVARGDVSMCTTIKISMEKKCVVLVEVED